jgi:subtilisin family serine protease
MAAPQISGLAALVLSARPGLRPGQVREVLQASAAGRGIAGTASGEVWAPAALGLPDQPGGAPGAARQDGGAGGGQGAGGGPAGTRTAGLGPLRIVLRRTPRRLGRARRVTLRWTVLGDASSVRRLRVDVDGRRRATLRATARRVTLRLRPGRHRVVIRALDARRRVLARSSGRRFRLARTGG